MSFLQKKGYGRTKGNYKSKLFLIHFHKWLIWNFSCLMCMVIDFYFLYSFFTHQFNFVSAC
jgi:hypothetical protein